MRDDLLADPLICSIRAIAALVALGTLGCASSDATRDTVVVSGSAGIEVIAFRHDAAEAWQLAPAPDFVVGLGDDEAGELPFHDVRGGQVFADGAFVVADGGSGELRFFGADGILQRTAGRRGRGPREFQSIAMMHVLGDSLWVFDRTAQRISVWSTTGEFVRSIALVDAGSVVPADVVGIHPDGALVLSASVAAAPAAGPGVRRAYRTIWKLEPGGALTEGETYFRGEHYVAALEQAFASLEMPFAREGITRTHGYERYYSDGSSYQIHRYDGSDRIIGILQVDRPTQRLRAADLDAWLAEHRAQHGERAAGLEPLYREIPLPPHRPTYEDLIVDRNGRIWAALHPESPLPRCWDIFEPAELRLAQLCTTERVRVLDALDDWLLVVSFTSADAETISRYRVLR